MFPFKKILCPTDFSEPSLCGIKMAKEMGIPHGSEIILLNVHKPIPHLPTPRTQSKDINFDVSAYEKAIVAEAKEDLLAIKNRILGEDVEAQIHVHIGDPAKEILQVAKEEEVDCICIATHGRSGLAKIVFGSVAHRIVRRAHCPVITVRMCG